MKRKHTWKVMALLLSVSLMCSIVGCGATPEPEVIEVEKVVTQVVQETVKETVVVEGTAQVVEKEVTRVVEVEAEVEAPAEPTTLVHLGVNKGLVTLPELCLYMSI